MNGLLDLVVKKANKLCNDFEKRKKKLCQVFSGKKTL